MQYLPSRRLPSSKESQPNIQVIFMKTEHEQTVIEVKLQALSIKWKGSSLLLRKSQESSQRRRQINQKTISMHLQNFFFVSRLGIANDTPSKVSPRVFAQLVQADRYATFPTCNNHRLKYSSCHQSSYQFHPSLCPLGYNE